MKSKSIYISILILIIGCILSLPFVSVPISSSAPGIIRSQKENTKLVSIQEIPSMNIAEVSVTYKKEDKTPFYDVLEKDKTDFNTKKIALKKTENNGWIYCEK